MTVRRVVGLETEFGISVLGNPTANAMTSSSQVVNAYAAAHSRQRRPRWDFEEENPLRDARGFDLAREVADPTLLTDEEVGLANVVLTNGARLYVDHAHPEYSTPEVTDPRAAVVWDKAGDLVITEAGELASASYGVPLVLYKNNTDGKGASYGTHENYLMNRATPFERIVAHLTPFFVSRPVITGAGRLGVGQETRSHAYQISQRADFFEVEVGLETTLKRPIINTRDEPHADADRYRRLHVIVGDANLSEVATYLKVGMTSLVLAMIEDGWLDEPPALADPVEAMHQVSHDPTLQMAVPMADGSKMTGLDIQRHYCDQAHAYVRHTYGNDVDAMTADVLSRWSDVLDRLGRDPMLLAGELDWVAKLALLEGYRQRDGLDWSSPKLALIDLQYHDLRPRRSLYQRLVSTGRMQRLVSDAEVLAAVTAPPDDTRAYFRGRCLDKYAEDVAAASWDSVIFDVPGRDALQRVPTMEPLRGTKAHVGALLDSAPTAADLLARLSQPNG
ncbi:MAG: depupylase/deamidase Dop [Jiangellales bacterium]